jgi:hypothetical protein
MEANKFQACAPPHCQCPEIEIIEGDRIIIKDDYRGEVTMTCSEFEMIIKWYNSRSLPAVPAPVMSRVLHRKLKPAY